MIPESEQAGGGGLNHTSDLLDPRRAGASRVPVWTITFKSDKGSCLGSQACLLIDGNPCYS